MRLDWRCVGESFDGSVGKNGESEEGCGEGDEERTPDDAGGQGEVFVEGVGDGEDTGRGDGGKDNVDGVAFLSRVWPMRTQNDGHIRPR